VVPAPSAAAASVTGPAREPLRSRPLAIASLTITSSPAEREGKSMNSPRIHSPELEKHCCRETALLLTLATEARHVWFAASPLGSSVSRAKVNRRTASERRGDNLKGFEGFYLKAKARIWPGLSYVCQIRSTAALRDMRR